MLRCTGLALRIESKPWNMTENGQSRSGISHTVRVLVGDADFVDVKYDDQQAMAGLLPRKGQVVDLAVVASAPGGRLTVKYRCNWADVPGVDALEDVVPPQREYDLGALATAAAT